VLEQILRTAAGVGDTDARVPGDRSGSGWGSERRSVAMSGALPADVRLVGIDVEERVMRMG